MSTPKTPKRTGPRPKKAHRGLAAMSPEKRSEIASKGGKAAHAQGKAHQFTTDEARTAGAKGGTAVSKDRAYMAKIGALGGSRGGKGKVLPIKLPTKGTP